GWVVIGGVKAHGGSGLRDGTRSVPARQPSGCLVIGSHTAAAGPGFRDIGANGSPLPVPGSGLKESAGRRLVYFDANLVSFQGCSFTQRQLRFCFIVVG